MSRENQGSHARSKKEGAGRSSDPGSGQYAESGSRKEAERQKGEVARGGLTDSQHETGQKEDETS